MIGKKFTETAAVKTHGTEDAGLVDLINPVAELDKTASTVRSLIHGAVGWVARGYKENKTIGF